MGTNYDPREVDRLQPGMSKSDVLSRLGPPNSTTTTADGSEIVVWLHSQGSMLGASARSVGLLFGKDGRLVRVINTTETQVN